MSVTGLAILYIIIWWIIFFSILPIDVDRNKPVEIEGEDPGSPQNPKMLKIFLKWISNFSNFVKVIFQLAAAEFCSQAQSVREMRDIYCMTNSRQNTLTRPTANYLFDFGVTLCFCSEDIFMGSLTLKTKQIFLSASGR